MPSPGDCLGREDCSIEVTDIQLDIVNWTSATEFEKTQIHLIASSETPWMARIIQLCQNGFVEYEGRRLFAYQCLNLRDFKVVTPEEEEPEA
jgi:hypothetical protein